MKDNKGGRYKQIQDEQKKIRSLMNESDDTPMIFVDLLEAGSGKRKTQSLIFGSES